jgi:hypothetical protein
MCIMNIFCFIILDGELPLMACVDLVHYKYGDFKDLLDTDGESLNIVSLDQNHASYLQLLCEFFFDEKRAKKYTITGDIYSAITHSAVEYLLEREQPFVFSTFCCLYAYPLIVDLMIISMIIAHAKLASPASPCYYPTLLRQMTYSGILMKLYQTTTTTSMPCQHRSTLLKPETLCLIT